MEESINYELLCSVLAQNYREPIDEVVEKVEKIVERFKNVHGKERLNENLNIVLEVYEKLNSQTDINDIYSYADGMIHTRDLFEKDDHVKNAEIEYKFLSSYRYAKNREKELVSDYNKGYLKMGVAYQCVKINEDIKLNKKTMKKI